MKLPSVLTGPQERWQVRIAVAFLVAFVLLAFWKLAAMKGLLITDDIFASDMMNENFPYRFSIGEALKSGQWPLWVREIYGGFPLLARSEAGVCYPPNLVLFGLFSPYVALNLTILLTLVTAGVGMYFYAREIGCQHLAALLGGIAFCLCGYLLSHLKHLSMANAAGWLPVGLLLLERAIRQSRVRPLFWFALVFGLQHLAGNAQTAYYAGVLYVLYFAFRFLNQQKESRIANKEPLSRLHAARAVLRSRVTWVFAGMLVLGSLLAAVQLIPTYEMVSLSQRSGGVTFAYAANYAYDLKDFWTFLYPYSSGDAGNMTYTGKGIFWEDYGYVGAITFLLALSAPLRKWKNWHVRFFSLTALVSYLLVLGPATPIFKLVFDGLPGMHYFRFPTRLLLVTDLALVTLAALALPQASRQFGRWIVLVQALALALVASDLLYFQLRLNPTVDSVKWRAAPRTAEFLQQDASLFRVFCLGGNHSHKRMFERAGGWEGDLQPFVEQREFLQPSSNILYGLSSPNGYANLTPNYIVDIWGDQNRPGLITQTASIAGGYFAPAPLFWKLMRMYNVKYLTSFWPFAASPHLVPIGIYGEAFLYRNDDLLPRAYLVGEVVSVADEAAALAMLRTDGFAPERSVLLEEMPPDYQPGTRAGGSVEFLHYTTNQAVLRVVTAGAGILVFSDSYYPGWRAEVDGQETRIYRANVTQRAVLVPAGQHRVTFAFRPTTVAVGFWISMGTLLVLLGCFVLPLVTTKKIFGKTKPNNPLPA